jgi:hypothetical protein
MRVVESTNTVPVPGPGTPLAVDATLMCTGVDIATSIVSTPPVTFAVSVAQALPNAVVGPVAWNFVESSRIWSTLQ